MRSEMREHVLGVVSIVVALGPPVAASYVFSWRSTPSTLLHLGLYALTGLVLAACLRHAGRWATSVIVIIMVAAVVTNPNLPFALDLPAIGWLARVDSTVAAVVLGLAAWSLWRGPVDRPSTPAG